MRRIAVEQIDAAMAEIDDKALDEAETVHQVRKRCKKLRGLVRLVRPAFAAYSRENAAFRDAAAGLSFVRDAEVLLETFDGLIAAFRDGIEAAAFATIRGALAARRDAVAHRRDLQDLLAAFRVEMEAARERAADWALEADEFDALAGGLRRTYGRAVDAMAAARAERTAEAFHEWRKGVKYHFYHTRLLAPVWPGPMQARRDAADRLGEVLGRHHDLAVFQRFVTEDPDLCREAAEREVLLGLAARRQADLELEPFGLGRRLFAEPAKPLSRRWAAWWAVWREEQSA